MAARPSILLPGAVRITHAVDAARYALWVFLRMDAQPRALEQWLARPYREAMRFGASTRALSLGTEETDVSILEAQRATVGVIEAAASGARTLTDLLPSRVHVVRAQDRDGGRGFLPIDVPGASLFDKVLALALADYLTRPADFLTYRYVSPLSSPLATTSPTNGQSSAA